MDFLKSLGSLFGTVSIIFVVLVVFNFMILIHEWGHFLAARWRGLKIDKFYIWFGKPLWKKTINGVEYGLGSLPLGGFVALPQMANQGGIEGQDSGEREQLPKITPLDKIIVAFAGPLFSFLLAVAFAIIVTLIGTPKGRDYTDTTIGYVQKDSGAAQAGLMAGDKILTIDGNPVKRFNGPVDSVLWAVIASEGDTIEFVVERDGKQLPPMQVIPTKDEPQQDWLSFLFKRPPLRRVGIAGATVPMAGKVIENSPAYDAGVKTNDVITAIDGKLTLGPGDLGEYIKQNGAKPVRLSIDRHGEKLELVMTPRPADKWSASLPADATEETKKEQSRLLVGILWDDMGKRELAFPTIGEQVSDGFKSMARTIEKVISPRSDLGVSHMSGFLGIFRIYYNLFEQENAWKWIIAFSVLLNINLAVMNMLPFPVLDGGHITMALMQIFTRREPGGKLLELVQTACVLMLMSFMLWVTLKDAGDWFGSKRAKSKDPTPIFLPAAQRNSLQS
jgi:regulator of sigma E protease